MLTNHIKLPTSTYIQVYTHTHTHTYIDIIYYNELKLMKYTLLLITLYLLFTVSD
jgi:hypothetical protein